MASLAGLIDDDVSPDESPVPNVLTTGAVPSIGPPRMEATNAKGQSTTTGPSERTTTNGVDYSTTPAANDSPSEPLDLEGAARDYIDKGWHLVPIPYGQKGPKTSGWNEPANLISTHAQVSARLGDGGLQNIGLQHQASGTCAIDVDSVQWTKVIFDEFGLDYEGMVSKGLRIFSKEGRDKVIFSAPAGLDLHPIRWPKEVQEKKNDVFTVFELRAGAVQDVLPPSRHPGGHDYLWWPEQSPMVIKEVPDLPAELLEFWRAYSNPDGKMKQAVLRICPWVSTDSIGQAPKSKPRAAHNAGKGPSVIDAFNAAYPIEDVLERCGYKRKGKKFLAPSSSTSIPGVTVFDNGRCFSHHGSDVLADGYAHDSFSVFELAEHNGDLKAAIKAAARELGIEREDSRMHAPRTAQAGAAVAGQAPGSQVDAEAAGGGNDDDEDEGLSGLSLAPVFNYDMCPGILGDFIRSETEHSEAPPIGILGALASRLSADLGRTAYYEVGHAIQHIRMNWLASGASGSGRKGTSASIVNAVRRKVFEEKKPDKPWEADRYAPAKLHDPLKMAPTYETLSTSEGLIAMLRTTKSNRDEGEETPPGLLENRLFVDAQEFSSILKKAAAKEATLSGTLRLAGDGSSLVNASKSDGMRAENPHIVVGASVPDSELVKLLTGDGAVEVSNGLINRFTLTYQGRGKIVPRPRKGDEQTFHEMVCAYKLALAAAWGHGGSYSVGKESSALLTRTDEAEDLYCDWYQAFSGEPRDQIMENLLIRAPTTVKGYAALLALLRGSRCAEVGDIRAAITLVDYWTSSLEFIFSRGKSTAATLQAAADAHNLLSRLAIGEPTPMRKLKDIGTAEWRNATLNWAMRQSPPWVSITREDPPSGKGRKLEIVTRIR